MLGFLMCFHYLTPERRYSSQRKTSSAGLVRQEPANSTLTKGKFVLCFQTRNQRPSNDAALSVYTTKGIGVIFTQIPSKTIPSAPLIPCIQVDFEVGTSIISYIQTSR